MKKILIIILLCGITKSYAHDVTEVTFKIEPLENHIKVTVDLPWTLKDALEFFDESLKNDKSRANFNRILKTYVETHFIIWSNDRKIPLRRVKEAPVGNKHVHGAYFNFFFNAGKITKIENTFLFETHPKQRNINNIKIKNNRLKYQTTTKERSFYLIEEKPKSHKNLIILIAVFLSICGLITYFLFKKDNK